MKVDKAKSIVLEIAGARKKWGKQANPPYSIHQIMDALVAISDELQEVPVSEKPATPPEEVTKLRRQLAACQNREKVKKGRAQEPVMDAYGEHDPDIDENGICRVCGQYEAE